MPPSAQKLHVSGLMLIMSSCNFLLISLVSVEGINDSATGKNIAPISQEWKWRHDVLVALLPGLSVSDAELSRGDCVDCCSPCRQIPRAKRKAGAVAGKTLEWW